MNFKQGVDNILKREIYEKEKPENEDASNRGPNEFLMAVEEHKEDSSKIIHKTEMDVAYLDIHEEVCV